MLDVPTIKKYFLDYNRHNLTRTRAALRNRQRDFLDVIPLLFHTNYPILPGFVTKHTPAGISGYTPDKPAMDAGKRLVRSFNYNSRSLPRYDIHSLFMMGSSGTIAYSEKSDFDIWLCHRPGLSDEQLAELQQKANIIEEWAASLNLEAHFFLMEAESFKSGKYVELSSESSGSAQHHLLLEEFYRTGLLLAGRYPMWWLVPAGEEANYDAYAHNLRHKRFVREDETIDFGGLPTAPVEEFFGAALWQLSKGIDSPYKAVLKLMLMEIYAYEYPHVDLLCLRFKRAIHEGTTETSLLDPYIMLYKKIEEYLEKRGDHHRLALVRRCFYFKVNESLGAPDNPRNMTWRRELLKELVQSWSWNKAYLKILDSRPQWKIHRVLSERKSLVGALTQGYRFLSDFARSHTRLTKINQDDLNILGRKLYAAFERKAGKIEIVNRGISEDVWESHLSFHHAGKGDLSGWILYRGIVTVEDADAATPLRRSRSLIELIAWCFFNKMMDNRTAIILYPQQNSITLKEFEAIARTFNQLFPDAQFTDKELYDLSRPPTLSESILFVNVGMIPLSKHARSGRCLTSSRTDALSYGGIYENLVLSFDLVLQTSWQEVLTFRYESEDGIIDCLGAYLQWAPPSRGILPPPLGVYCFSPGRGPTIAKRVEGLFSDIVSCFYGDEQALTARYVLRIGRTHYVLHMENDVLQYRKFDSYNGLLEYLSEPQPAFSTVVLDRHALSDSLLPLVYSKNQAGKIQLFYHARGNSIDIYILDEKGALFYQRTQAMEIPILLNQYKRFFEAVCHRCLIQAPACGEYDILEGDETTEFYQVITNRWEDTRLARREVNTGQGAGGYFNLQVIGNIVEGRKPVFTIYCDDCELTSLEFGDRLFQEAAHYVLEKRRSGLRYPIYITDIDLPRTLLGKTSTDPIQTIHYLKYKKHIEEKLNAALLRINLDPAVGNA